MKNTIIDLFFFVFFFCNNYVLLVNPFISTLNPKVQDLAYVSL